MPDWPRFAPSYRRSSATVASERRSAHHERRMRRQKWQLARKLPAVLDLRFSILSEIEMSGHATQVPPVLVNNRRPSKALQP
jgi:hypothetical protein